MTTSFFDAEPIETVSYPWTLTSDPLPTDRMVALYGPGDPPAWEMWIQYDGKVYRQKAGGRPHRVRFGIGRPFMRVVRDRMEHAA